MFSFTVEVGLISQPVKANGLAVWTVQPTRPALTAKPKHCRNQQSDQITGQPGTMSASAAMPQHKSLQYALEWGAIR